MAERTPDGIAGGLLGCWAMAVLIFAMAIVLAGTAQARDVRVGVSGEMIPFFYTSDGEWHGASIDVARHVLERTGHRIVAIYDLPMRRLENRLRTGTVDIQPNWTPTPVRREVAVFTSTPHVFEEHVFIVRRNDPIPYSGSLESLAGVRLAAMRGWTHGPDFDGSDAPVKFFMRSVPAQVRVLAKGRVDVAVQNARTFLASAQAIGFDTGVFDILQPATASMPVFMGISKGVPDAGELREALDREISLFVKTDEYRAILQRYNLISFDNP